VKLPPAKVPAYDLAKKNPYPIKSKALGNRNTQRGQAAPRRNATRLSLDDARRKYQKRVQGGANREQERQEFIRQTGIDPETGQAVK
jgi:hypothetical protein